MCIRDRGSSDLTNLDSNTLFLSFKFVFNSFTDGPDAISEGLPSITSDIKILQIFMEFECINNFPPLTEEVFFRIKFIIFISYPDFNKRSNIICFSFKLIPSSGAATRELPPPEIRNIIKSFGCVVLNSFITFFAAIRLYLFGIG